ncbi:Heterokaryon incompatibility protein 6,OR allele [Lachnellula willkommii]|uniref:Heterokaryon incompatibility protein 6,OR allele n=1 Tax=Lachnellula willkommii TaxID=215461 RepID=A0A559MDW0_9HELO|nr:Heterokaryon incompatibility protein 6,OR allele [Lachnellula willkommii]
MEASNSYSRLDESRDEIRLITLSPLPNEFDLVHCKLETVSLADITPEYRTFTLSSDDSSLGARKTIRKWSQSRSLAQESSSPAKDDEYCYTPSTTSYRFIWGDFAALSYVWGDENVTGTIVVNGQEREVTANLEEALRAFCSRDEFTGGFKLWVDAICINQNDLVERGRQVRRMREIYGTAWTVVAWLGEECDQSHKAIQLVQDLAGFSNDKSRNQLEKWLREDPGFLGNGSWLALQEFMDRMYWYRLWILQELIMGSSAVLIQCGSSSIEWKTFCAGISLLEEDLWLVKDGLLRRDVDAQGRTKNTAWSTASLHLVYQDLSVLSQLEETAGDAGDPQYLSFGRILDIANWAECMDPRDKVYGLVGLMKPDIAQHLVPDYTIHPMSVYANATKLFIQSSGSLDPIREGNPWGPTQTPSWIADWQWEGRARMSRTENQLWGPSWLSSKSNASINVPYHASGASKYEATFSGDSLLLTCKGFIIDSVLGLSARGQGYFAWSKASINQTSQWKSIYGDKTATSEALYQTLVADRVSGGNKADARHSVILHLPATFSKAGPQFKKLGWSWLSAQENYYFRWQKWRAANRDFLLGDDKLGSFFDDKVPKGASEFDFTEVYSCFDRTCQKRRLMTTKNGYLGWAPDNIYGGDEEQTRSGDLVAIVFGCSTPMIIRPMGKWFLVVGEAYVQGIMDGEAMEVLETGKAKIQSFTFC